MGTELNQDTQDATGESRVLSAHGWSSVPEAPSTAAVPQALIIPWLDPATAAGVVDIVQSLAADHREALAVILFGSVARHEERPLDDPEPSDVDLLLLLDASALEADAHRLSRQQELALHRTI